MGKEKKDKDECIHRLSQSSLDALREAASASRSSKHHHHSHKHIDRTESKDLDSLSSGGNSGGSSV